QEHRLCLQGHCRCDLKSHLGAASAALKNKEQRIFNSLLFFCAQLNVQAIYFDSCLRLICLAYKPLSL
ncbi:MAG: hypothetical protein RR707_15160, partial [Comamonas sp.]